MKSTYILAFLAGAGIIIAGVLAYREKTSVPYYYDNYKNPEY